MIFDISQEITNCKVYPGDPGPVIKKVSNMEDNALYNLSTIFMCAHNGTHVDAPSHFINNGKSINDMPLESFVGKCYVYTHNNNVTELDALNILKKAQENNACERILIKGNCVITAQAAKVFKKANIKLLGNESQSVGPIDSPMEVHKILLSSDIVLLEGIVLKEVTDGVYYLCAQPLNIKGIEGAPCRAILIKE